MNKQEFVKFAAKRANFSQPVMTRAVEAITESIMDIVAAGGEVNINGFGQFCQERRNARMGRNPKTGESIPIPARHLPCFKPGVQFRTFVAETMGEKKPKR